MQARGLRYIHDVLMKTKIHFFQPRDIGQDGFLQQFRARLMAMLRDLDFWWGALFLVILLALFVAPAGVSVPQYKLGDIAQSSIRAPEDQGHRAAPVITLRCRNRCSHCYSRKSSSGQICGRPGWRFALSGQLRRPESAPGWAGRRRRRLLSAGTALEFVGV